MKPTPEQEAHARHVIADRQITLEDWIASQPKEARGQTCTDEDMPRLNEQTSRVYGALRNLRPWTLRELSIATGDPEASCSARIREIRRYLETDGKGTVLRTRVEGGNGLHHYTMRLTKYCGAA